MHEHKSINQTQRGGLLLSKLFVYAVFALVVIFVVVPIAWIIGLSFKTTKEIFTSASFFGSAGIKNYVHIMTKTKIPRYILNSLIVTIGAASIALIVSVSAAYGCSRWNFKWKYLFLVGLLGLQFLPGATSIVPFYVVLSRMNLLNTYVGLIIILGATRVPFTIWVLKGFFDTVPRSIEEAALIDGASRYKTILLIFLPLAFPGIAAAVFINILHAWNAFLLPLVINTSTNMKVALVGLVSYQNQEGGTYYNYMAAAGITNGLLMVLLYFFVQKGFVSGMMAGSIK